MNYGERPVHIGCQLKNLDNAGWIWFDASRMTKVRRSLQVVGVVWVGAVGWAGCVGSDPVTLPSSEATSLENRTMTAGDLASDCPNLPMNQKATLMAPVRTGFPLKIQIDPSFSSDLQAAIQWGLKTWNSYSRAQVGYSFFMESRWDGNPQEDRPTSSGDCSFDKPDESGFRIFQIASLVDWKLLGFTESNPAATLRCQSKGKLTRQIIGVYSPSMRVTQYRSVVLHELGHALGLDHSCKISGGNEQFVSCSDIPAGHPYRIAAMYPTLRVSGKTSSTGSVSTTTDEVKEMLQENDRSRASCLYSVTDQGDRS
jgi:hypothetical protein